MTELADLIARHYHEDVDRDLLIAGAILHDIGKIEEIELSGGFPYTDPGKLLGHILLGIELVRSEEHTSELQSRGHIVCRLLLEKKKSLIQNQNSILL